MTHLLCIALFCLFALGTSSDVIDLTETDFDEKTKDGLWTIKFVAPWCGHCKKLAPTWEEVASELKKEGKDVHIASVDVTQFPSLGKRFGVSGYPTILKMHKGTVEEYGANSRAKDALKEWSVVVPIPKTIQEKAQDLFKLLVRQFEIMINHTATAAAVLLLLGFLVGMLTALLFFTRTKVVYVNDPGLTASAGAAGAAAAAKKSPKKVD